MGVPLHLLSVIMNFFEEEASEHGYAQWNGKVSEDAYRKDIEKSKRTHNYTQLSIVKTLSFPFSSKWRRIMDHFRSSGDGCCVFPG
ncbi:unnamed protein product [Pieris macdunnoughi]|uniref:Uncharacterized protein n=1 Tax=Pieris macdunnoughi TaxID=345717 RepID=A0A821Y651_9NEOP|nr:unnamed protein product [Pieris macdunnoughi]